MIRHRFTYGDFPDLFWDASPDAPLNPEDPTTLARLLTRADARTVSSVVSLEEIRERLSDLPLPEETRVFWEHVVQPVTIEDS